MVCTSRRRSGQEDCSEENDLFSIMIGRSHPFIQLHPPCDRFFRTDASRSQVSGGTGLGLAIVQSITLLHGGNVQISSEPGKGTRVTLSVPVSQPSMTKS